MTRAFAWNWLNLWLCAPGGGHFFWTYEPNWTRLGAAAFKMVVGLLSPQLSRFFHTVTVFDSPALPNNCHKRLIIHYCLFCFFFVQKIKSVTDVNSTLGSLCHRLTASSKFISSFCFTLQLTNWLHFLIPFFCSLCFAFAWIHVSFSITVQWKTLSPILLHSLANRTHNHIISRSHRLQL